MTDNRHMVNPFAHRSAIRNAGDFHGRERLIDEVYSLLLNGQSISLVGPRRIGKSSLLLHLARPTTRQSHPIHQENPLFVLIDCQELAGASAEEVYELLFDAIRDAAEDTGVALEEAVQANINHRTLDRALNRLVRQGARPILMLDEFELMAGNDQLTPNFFARLRGLTTKYGVSFITASQKPLYALTASEEVLSSPFFNIFVSLSLGGFTEAEANSLFAVRLAGQAISFSDSLRQKIIHWVGTHPFFLHLVSYHAYQRLLNGEEESGPFIADLEKAAESEIDSHFRYVWDNLTGLEQTALVVLTGPVESMRTLEQLYLVTEEADPTGRSQSYHYRSYLLERFVRRQSVTGIVQSAPFVIDLQRHAVSANRQSLDLTVSQFNLFVTLARHAGQVVQASDLERAVWGEALVDDPDRLKTLIKRLRRSLEPYDGWIVSERGVGYALRQPI